MSNSSERNLTSLVNASGFLFQLGLERQIALWQNDHRWRTISHEHPWRYGEDQGFIDLVLSKEAVLAVIECKRPRDGTWAFLVPADQSSDISRLRCLWLAGSKDRTSFAGWDDLDCLPTSYESEFCVVRGSGEGDRSLLERLSAMLLTSIDGLSEEEVSILQTKEKEYFGFYLPLIVTTADLQVCRFRPEDVDMTTGDVSNATFESVPFVRFRKAFSTVQPPNTSPRNLKEAAVTRQRSVIVVNAANLVNLLTGFKVLENDFSPFPWQAALQMKKNQR